jgi:hypothetical protein
MMAIKEDWIKTKSDYAKQLTGNNKPISFE